MKLYKFRPLHPFEHVADILMNRRLYCSEYRNLNDPFEGVFTMALGGGGLGLGQPSSQSTNIAKTVDELDETLAHTRICSFSSTLGDLRLWSHYADGHRGIAIEIDFPETGQIPKKVTYVNSIPSFGMGLLADSPNVSEILCTKTNHWEYEAEYRLIHDNEYFSVEDMTMRVFLGTRISSTNLDLLRKLVPSEIEQIPTSLNSSDMRVKSTMICDDAT